MSNTIRKGIDRAGRIVIPRRLREEVGLVPGQPVSMKVQNGALVVAPAPLPVRIRKDGNAYVAEPTEALPPLEESVLRDLRREIRERSA